MINAITKFMQGPVYSGNQFTKDFYGGGVGDEMERQQGLFQNLYQQGQNLSEGNIPQAVRQQLYSTGQDSSAEQAMLGTRNMMAMGADPSSGQGGMMQAILQNQARNNATNQMANMIPQFMNQGYNLQQQGLKGMGDLLSQRQGVNVGRQNLIQSNLADRSNIRRSLIGGAAGMLFDPENNFETLRNVGKIGGDLLNQGSSFAGRIGGGLYDQAVGIFT